MTLLLLLACATSNQRRSY